MIRPAEEPDRDAIAALLRASGLPDDMGWFPAHAVVHDDRAAVAGYEIHGDSGLLRSVAVAPGMRGRGRASALVSAVLKRLADQGVRDAYLLTETAAGYFPRFGFAPIARDGAPAVIKASPQFSALCAVSAVLMHRRG